MRLKMTCGWETVESRRFSSARPISVYNVKMYSLMRIWLKVVRVTMRVVSGSDLTGLGAGAEALGVCPGSEDPCRYDVS